MLWTRTQSGLGRTAAILAVVMLAVATAGARGGKPTVKQIGDGLICQCGGCNFPVSTCNHEQCSSRDEMNAIAAKEIAAGKDETTILQDFVLRYGVKVLSTPPASGFNLSVWILPGVGLVVGLALVIALARRWRKTALPPAGAVKDPRVDAATLAAIEEEMKTSGLV
ncbi:MAG TPA: cytochrome c-type biogenesis protein CcmH [Terriglobia bacterium]|nr:cytochrome c-type biogenesis protein CcmH [Terriglobia bacterium]